MAPSSRPTTPRAVVYRTGDGKPVGETPVHRDIILETVFVLQQWFEANPMAYVSGNMFMYYVEGDKRRHLSPDVFATLGIPNDGRRRDAYFVWEEGKGPDFVLEVTSKSTRREDQVKKLELYRDVLNVREYFQIDPYGEYLKPRLKGYRKTEGRYDPIEPVAGRVPSEVLSLHLEASQEYLRLFDPAHDLYLLYPKELRGALAQQSQEMQEREARHQAEIERLRQEIEELRRRSSRS